MSLLVAGTVLTLCVGAPAQAADPERCAAPALASKLHERLKSDGRTDSEIRDIRGSGMKRRVMRSRVVEDSGCTADEVDAALRELEAATKG